jgi:glutamate-ammonia-ligase adenylyltransferase
MMADRQTHSLPERPADLARFATFMGYADAGAFAAALLDQLSRVRARYAEVFELVPDLPGGVAVGPVLDFSGPELPQATMVALGRLRFSAPERVAAAVRGWMTGHVRALRSERARDLMGQMLPAILTALGRQPHTDESFARFDAFLSRQPAGVQLLSLFQRNPALLERVAAVLGASPSLSDHLARTPGALDGLLNPEEETDFASRIRSRLADGRTLEDAIAIIRRTVKEADFNISVATMEGRLNADAAGERRSALAGAALDALLDPVLDDFARRFGRVRGGEMAVVAMGKAGGREMMAGSDLDLMLIYDHPEDASDSEGGRPLPASQWFVRASHAYVAAVTAPGVDGQLYAVDMRLRPSGNKGPVAVSLGGFQRYHAENAWTWERMALTRARIVAGPPALRASVEGAIAAALAGGDPSQVLADAASMRSRMARDLPPDGPWDVKQRPGGLVDVEFIAQALQLLHARERRDVCSPTTRIALQRLADAGFVAEADATLLIRADRLWRTVQGMLRITVGRNAQSEPPDASLRPLLRAMGQAGAAAVDLPALRVTLDGLATDVRAAFVRLIGEVG